MTKLLLIAFTAATLAACSENEQDEKDETPAVVSEQQNSSVVATATESPTAPADAANNPPPVPTPKPTPKYGPKTTRESFEVVGGGRLAGDEFVQSHFGIVGGYLSSDANISKVIFRLYSDGSSGAYPIVKLLIYPPGAKEWKELGSHTVKNDLEQEYDIDGKPGRYAFRVIYGGTEPEIAGRPGLVIRSVELQ